jgi:hypothetical protein
MMTVVTAERGFKQNEHANSGSALLSVAATGCSSPVR